MHHTGILLLQCDIRDLERQHRASLLDAPREAEGPTTELVAAAPSRLRHRTKRQGTGGTQSDSERGCVASPPDPAPRKGGAATAAHVKPMRQSEGRGAHLARGIRAVVDARRHLVRRVDREAKRAAEGVAGGIQLLQKVPGCL